MMDKPLNYTLLITEYNTSEPSLAIPFALSLLNAGHQLEQVFFYHDGSATAALNNPLAAQWVELSAEYNIVLNTCISAAKLRDVEVKTPFNIVGMGELIEAQMTSDRVVSFAQ